MTQRSRLHQTKASESSSKGSKVNPDFLPSLLYDDLEHTRNSVGLVHPFVLESLFEDTRGASKQPSRKTALTTPKKSSENADTSKNEEPKRRVTLNRTSRAKNVFFGVGGKNIPVDEEPLTSTKTLIKSNSETLSNESKSRKSSTCNTETTKTKRQTTSDSKDVVAKTTSNTKKDEVLPTRESRSSRRYAEPIRKLRSVNDFSIENMDWYYEDEKYYKKNCNVVMSDFAIPKERRQEMNAKLSYTYLLLDSRRCKNKTNISWLDFIKAIFYIGRGKDQRAFQHTKDAEKWLDTTDNKKATNNRTHKKFLKIKEIWDSGNPIEVFLITEKIIDTEASTREAAMIDAMGLARLCNLKRGSYYGVAITMKAIERLELGATLLMEARDIFRWKKATDVYPRKKLAIVSIERPYFRSDSDEDEIYYAYEY